MDFGPGEIIEGVLRSEPGPSRKKLHVSAGGIHDRYFPVDDAYHFIGTIPFGVSSKINNRPFPTSP